MRTEPELHTHDDMSDVPASLAGYLLTAERVVMGFVLLGFGISGLLNVASEAFLPPEAAAVGGVMMKVGFAYPLLKGVEVLLELYSGRQARKQQASVVRLPSAARPVRRPRRLARCGSMKIGMRVAA